LIAGGLELIKDYKGSWKNNILNLIHNAWQQICVYLRLSAVFNSNKLPSYFRAVPKGVSIDIKVKESSISKDDTGFLAKTRENVLDVGSSNSLTRGISISKSLKYKELHYKYPAMNDKRVIMFIPKDDSTIQMLITGQDVNKIEDIKVSSTLKEFIKEFNKAGDEETRSDLLKNKIYFREYFPFVKKIDDASEGYEIILDASQFREYSDILNLYFGSKIKITSKHAVPEKVAQTLEWNEKTKFTPSDIVVVYSANPEY
jgi:hypothetical protein